MTDEEIAGRARRLSFTIAELDLIQAALSGLTIQAGKDLRDRVLKAISEEHDPAFRATVDAYRNAVEPDDGELEIDHDAEVSLGDDPGAYVMVWKWVSSEDAGLCRTCGAAYDGAGDGYDGACPDCADKTEAAREITCASCGDSTSEGGSPDGENCPDCHDRQENEA